MTSQSPGLRERKRELTRLRLEQVTIELALRDGLDKVTVDAISEQADVSPRTFFNYFETKEDALLGVRPPDVTDELLAAHRDRYADSDLIESVVGLLVAVMGPSATGSALTPARLQVLRQHPQLIDRMVSRMARTTEQLTGAVTLLLHRHQGVVVDDPDTAALAGTILMACIGGIRAATKQWTAGHTDFSVDDLELRAGVLVRAAVEALK